MEWLSVAGSGATDSVTPVLCLQGNTDQTHVVASWWLRGEYTAREEKRHMFFPLLLRARDSKLSPAPSETDGRGVAFLRVQ